MSGVVLIVWDFIEDHLVIVDHSSWNLTNILQCKF